MFCQNFGAGCCARRYVDFGVDQERERDLNERVREPTQIHFGSLSSGEHGTTSIISWNVPFKQISPQQLLPSKCDTRRLFILFRFIDSKVMSKALRNGNIFQRQGFKREKKVRGESQQACFRPPVCDRSIGPTDDDSPRFFLSLT